MLPRAHPPSSQPKQHLIGSVIFAGLTTVTAQQTDSNYNNRTHLHHVHSTAMWANNYETMKLSYHTQTTITGHTFVADLIY